MTPESQESLVIRHSRPVPCLAFIATLALVPLIAQAHDVVGEASAQIRRTGFGTPHILASDERGLGYGIGYAYAQDNLCLLANEVLTVNGERSRYLGADGQTFEQRSNLDSDLFFTWLNTPEAVKAFRDAQPAPIRALLDGYARGYNRALAERRVQGLPEACGTGDWVRAITPDDVVKLTRRVLVEGGLGQFAEALVGASPPTATGQGASPDVSRLAMRQARFALERGSNAVAVGGQRSANGKGLLLANPHFPWMGGLRFYQMQLTIPGRLNVMGAALPGFPLINIGFNEHVAWTHTVDTARHFTLHRLDLDPKDPTRYLWDGQSLPLSKQRVVVSVKGEDGQLRQVERQVYASRQGPIVQWPGRLDWDAGHAYALRDANLDNTRVMQQWYAINHADSLASLKTSAETIQGMPWVNTLAVDGGSQALYMTQSVIPYVDRALLERCADPRGKAMGLVVLDGSRSACQWKTDPQAAQPGIFPARLLPSLERADFVQNSNESAWMTNPAHPMTGFSPIVSRDSEPMGLRGRYALHRLQGSQALDAQDLRRLVTDNDVYLASLILPDVLRWCEQAGAEVKTVCARLHAWNGKAGLDSGIGLLHLQALAEALAAHPDSWRVPFDPADPANTPRGLAIDRAATRTALHEAALASQASLAQAGIDEYATWGQIQRSVLGTPVPGGPQELGIYNAMQSVPHGPGKRLVVSGSSYLQTVSFTDQGPKAQGVLAFSLSSEASSPHADDQTQAFARGQWHDLPFTEAQIAADPQLQRQSIREHDAREASGNTH